MLLFDGAFGVFMFGLWLFCIIDVITTPDGSARNLPKLLWLVIVVLLPDVGSLVWLIAGHPWGPRAEASVRGGRSTVSMPGARPSGRPTNPDDDEDFLAGLKARADEQRRRAREQQGEQPPAE